MYPVVEIKTIQQTIAEIRSKITSLRPKDFNLGSYTGHFYLNNFYVNDDKYDFISVNNKIYMLDLIRINVAFEASITEYDEQPPQKTFLGKTKNQKPIERNFKISWIFLDIDILFKDNTIEKIYVTKRKIYEIKPNDPIKSEIDNLIKEIITPLSNHGKVLYQKMED